MSSLLPYARYLFNKEGIRPFYLIYFVTHACNAQCSHCLQGDIAFSRRGDLSIEELERLTESMHDVLFMFLTGGEPFLREDLPEIARLFHRNCGVRKFQIPSNGSLGQRAVRSAERMARENPDAHFGVSISLDAVGEKHDESRVIKGLFEQACATFKELQKLERHYDNFNANVTITFSKGNEDEAAEIFRFARDELGAKNVFNSLVRGQPYKPASLEVDLDKFDRLNNLIDGALLDGSMAGYEKFPMADVVNAKNLVSRKLIAKTAREQAYQSPCYAGRVSAVIYAKGDVYPCEMLDTSFGNVRDVDFDFDRLWFSDRAERVKRHILEDKCFCTHECFVTHNIMFNPRFLPELAVNVARMKLARWSQALTRGRGESPPQ